MSKIQTFLDNILSARFGKDVRQSIHDAIQEVDKNADTAKDSATAMAEEARKSALSASENASAAAVSEDNARTYMQMANNSANSASTSEINAKTSETNSKASEVNAKVSEEHAQAVFESLPEDYGTLSKEFYEVAIKQKASGEDIHVTDSSNAKVREFALFGKARQQTTSGKNKLNNTATTKTINDGTFTINGDKSITINGKFTDEKETNLIISETFEDASLLNGKIFSGCTGGSYTTYFIRITDTANASFDNLNGESRIANLTNTGRMQVYISIKAGVTMNNVTIYPMISDNGGEYEPYTNGASPNPEFPQEIEVPSGNVVVKSCGKNELKNTATSKTMGNVTFTVNKDGSVSIKGTPDSNTSFILYEAVCDASEFNGKYISGCNDGSANTYFLRISDTKVSSANNYSTDKKIENLTNTGLVQVYINVIKGIPIDTTIYPMISLEGGEYEPYKETTATIPVIDFAGIEVSSGGNNVDSNGQEWLSNMIVKYADGSGERINNIEKCKLADLSWTYTGNEGERRFVSDSLVGIIAEPQNTWTKPIALCESYIVLSYQECYAKLTDKTMTVIFESSGLHGQLWLINTDFNNVDDFKNSLGDTLFYYQLKEPIITPLTAEEIAEIEKLQTFYPVTNISNDADCGMSVTYLCDSKNYIDSKIAELATAMVNSI